MQLSVWTYEGPSHVGAMRVAAAMPGVHLVLHAPQGDTYADLLFTMIERRATRPPVTYTTFGARDLGKDTAALFQNALAEAYERFRPEAIIVGSSCTAELIQDDPGGLARALALPVPVVPVEFHSYQRKENWGAAETFYALVRTFADAAPSIQAKRRHPVSTDAALSPSLRAERSNPGSTGAAAIEDGLTPEPLGPGSAGLLRSARNDDEGGPAARHEAPARRPRCNILGPTALGFRHRDDVAEVTRILEALGIEIGVTAPLGASPADLARLGEADFNVVLYPEIADTAARWLKRRFGQPFTTIVPIGVGATERFTAEVAALAGVDSAPALSGSRLPWFSRSVDSTYLTGKRVFVFGDATHAVAAAKVARDEFGFEVVGLGSYSREFARDVRAAAADFGLTALITDDSLEVEAEIVRLQPELVLGTQMERHVAKRLKIACAVISAPVHVQDFPARYSPQMGFEGANVLWDSWVHPLMMGLEEHLLGMFREDPEFHDGAAASHLGVSGGAAKAADLLPLRGECGSAEGRDGWGLAARGAAPEGLATPPVTPAACHPPLEGEGARSDPVAWSTDAERELKKIPFFVRGKARRNTEAFAEAGGLCEITLETLYDAKAHFSGR